MRGWQEHVAWAVGHPPGSACRSRCADPEPLCPPVGGLLAATALIWLGNVREPLSLGWKGWGIEQVVFYPFLCVYLYWRFWCLLASSVLIFFFFFTTREAPSVCAGWNGEPPSEIWVSDISCAMLPSHIQMEFWSFRWVWDAIKHFP